MPKYWILCMSEDNYSIAQQQELIGISERARTAIHKIAIGDMVTFQPSSRHPLLWWGMNSTLFGKYPLDQHPEPHGTSSRTLNV
jgi:hypothetical protein